MTYEFEGKTEREAIDNAVAELELERDKFDIEVLETQKTGFFGIGKRVRIRVHLADSPADRAAASDSGTTNGRREKGPGNRSRGNANAANKPNKRGRGEKPRRRAEEGERKAAPASAGSPPENDFEHGIADFLRSVTEKMGNPAEVSVQFREKDKVSFRLDAENNAMLIGRKGSTLDSIQTLANIVAGRIGGNDIKVIVDSENYRGRREEQLVKLAEKVGAEVKEQRKSRLLEPMNPFERRLIHTTLSNISGISTKSEGEGLYKQVRVYSKD
ncbi:MAG: RNA-binding cell elongation regulator Jag/EloR [Spirochaetales bacterium]